MLRDRLPALFLATLPALAVTAAGETPARAEDPGGRFPIWPTEIDRIAAPLRDPALMNEVARLAALEELQQYATAVILADVELALTDPSPEVRSAALQICASRRILACVDEAETMWEEGEGSVRLMALELLSQDPSEEHLELVYEAMRDPNDLIREHAINLLVDAPLQGKAADEARQEIVAQLGDVSARVRRTAARSLGRMGPGEGALALVRLLEDIDQGVAEAAAFGLGQLADPRTAPALRRALENPNNSNFAAAVVA
ncbi:MAG: HEAT repeat domain-containing protein, partial [Myxococcales bacterium]|nr:HEAT repeat domain-containing protein [Myxococcales bacterium]